MAGHQAVLGLYYTHPIEYTLTVNKLWSRRLTVRTPGFHPGNPGSIPGEITTTSTHLRMGVFRGAAHAAKRTRIDFAEQNTRRVR